MTQTQIKSHEASLKPSSEGFNASGLRLVKNASIFCENDVYFIRHYETIIYAYDRKNSKVEVNWHCSTTSDRQIRSALSFFNLDEDKTINVHDGEKWSHSGALV